MQLKFQNGRVFLLCLLATYKISKCHAFIVYYKHSLLFYLSRQGDGSCIWIFLEQTHFTAILDISWSATLANYPSNDTFKICKSMDIFWAVREIFNSLQILWMFTFLLTPPPYHLPHVDNCSILFPFPKYFSFAVLSFPVKCNFLVAQTSPLVYDYECVCVCVWGGVPL